MERKHVVQSMLRYTIYTVFPGIMNELHAMELTLSGNRGESLWEDDCDMMVQIGALAMMTGSFLLKFASNEEDDVLSKGSDFHLWKLSW